MLALLLGSMTKNALCFCCCNLAPPVVYLSLLEMLHPSSLECPLLILVIVWGVSSLVEVADFGFWVLIVVFVYPPLEMVYSILEVG